MKISTFFKVVFAVIFVFGCKKAEDRSCFKSMGKQSEKTIFLSDFRLLEVYEHLEVVLIQDSTDKLVISGGENLLNFVSSEITSEGVLILRNENKCNFLRKQNEKLKVEVHFTELINILFQGTEPMSCIDTIHSPYFVFLIRDGGGTVDLTVNSESVQGDISHGWGNYFLRGKSNFARIAARSNGYCDATDLLVRDSIRFFSNTQGTIKLRANGIPLRGEILVDGDVWYTGFPSEIDYISFASGKLISKN